MVRQTSWVMAVSVLAVLVPLSSAAQSPTAVAPATQTTFDRRAAQLVDVLRGSLEFSDYFAPSFQTAIPEAQFKAISASLIAQYGQPLRIDKATSTDGQSGTVLLRFEKGVGTIVLDVDALTDERVTGLRLTGFVVANDSYSQIAAEMAALPGKTGFLVAELGDADMRTLAAANDDVQFAVGSVFKLYVLAELAAQIEAGQRRWSDVVPLSHFSFSSAATANWPRDTPVTLQTLANWMISVSDNGAADTLIHLLGRENIEARMRAAGHRAPSRNIPFLTTVEAFALKGNNFGDVRPLFIAGDDTVQRRLIADHRDRLILPNVDGVSFTAGPRFIDSLEWFASPNDVARLMTLLRARRAKPVLAAMSINQGVSPVAAAEWRYLGYKGGSENGVLSMALLGERKSDGRWIVVTASWNNSDANVAPEPLIGLVTRLLTLAAK